VDGPDLRTEGDGSQVSELGSHMVSHHVAHTLGSLKATLEPDGSKS
jgi:hypothetical protein